MSNSKKVATGIVTTVVFAAALFITVRAHPDTQPSDTLAYYKTKCVSCHGKKAEKKFDSSLPDEQLIEIILKGKKAAKPPHMPGYGSKGVSNDQAKALLDHMKQLKAGQ